MITQASLTSGKGPSRLSGGLSLNAAVALSLLTCLCRQENANLERRTRATLNEMGKKINDDLMVREFVLAPAHVRLCR